MPDIEVTFNEDGSATIVDRAVAVRPEYDHNVQRFTVPKYVAELITNFFYNDGPVDQARATLATDIEEWHEDRDP